MKTPDIKFRNIEWLDPLRGIDPQLHLAVLKIHTAICEADNIIDGVGKPEGVASSLKHMIDGLALIHQNQEHFKRIYLTLCRIGWNEMQNVDFNPKEPGDLESDLSVLMGRSSLLDLYFEAFCCVEPSLDSDQNRDWFSKFKDHSLIYGDCEDILSETFEDLRMKRRNYVVLKTFGRTGYEAWEEKKEVLKEEAERIRSELSLEVPKDQRLMVFLSGCDNGDWVLKHS